MARALISALELGGHRVTLASRFRSFDAGDPARQERLRKVGLRMAGHVARRFESAAKPDAWFTYHLYHKAPDWLGPAVSERLAIPYVVAEASFAPKQDRGPWAIGHRGVGEALAHADRVFQPNPGDNACILPMLKCPDRLVPLKPFLDTRPFKANRPANRAEAAKRFGLDPSAPWLLAVAMMRNDQKLQSYRVLAEALRQLTDLPWELVVAGVGPAEAAVRSAFSDFADRIRWLGMLDRTQMIALYRGADLLVWPAIKEAWGMALLEAQAAGLPVVAGRSPGVAVVVAEGVSGILVREGDAVAFAGAVRQLLLRPDLRNTMREAAAERIGREHDIRMASAFLDRELAGLVGARKG